ncbi:MAG: hypothetical protein ACI9VS_003213 [Candidatus Binatia bacterium]
MPFSGRSTGLRLHSGSRLLNRNSSVRSRRSSNHRFAFVPESGTFSWKDFYIRMLIKINEPLATEKELPPEAPSAALLKKLNNPSSTTAALRRALESCFLHRKTKVVLIDEGQHLQKTGTGRRLHDHMDTLKSLSNITGVKFVLVGTYELLDMQHLNAQLARRCKPLHFARYRWDVYEDRIAFLRAIKTFQSRLPLAVPPDLLRSAEYLFERSAGCVGILKNWLTRALSVALATDGAISKAILKTTALPRGTVFKIAEDIERGETRYNEIEEGGPEQALQDLLGMNVPDQPAASSPSASPKSKLRPGERKPKRDPVGAPA